MDHTPPIPDIPSVVEVRDIPTVEEVRTPKGRPLIAWAVVALLVVGEILVANLRPLTKDSENKGRVQLVLFRLQSRYLVGAADVMRMLGGARATDLYREAKALNAGPLSQRLRFVAVAGEMGGSEEARNHLDRLRDDLQRHSTEPTASETAVLNTLGKLYGDYARGVLDGPSLGEEERALLRRELGWFGDLALAPAGGPNPEAREEVLGSARRTAILIVSAFMLGGLLSLAGLAGLIVLIVSWARGRARHGLAWQSPFSGVYAETFAVWMALFLVLGVAAAFLPVGDARLLTAGCAMLLSLAALAWPVFRGVPWPQVRHEIGLTAGRRPVVEVLLGAATYAMALPLLAVGMAIMLVLMVLFQLMPGAVGTPDDFSPTEMPAHPVIEYVAGPGWWGRLQVLFVASVVAPIVEETMFRGVLYRHLRDASVRLGFGLSVLVSGTLVSFVFAIIHPQGVIAVPGLMALAYAFTLAREWRGTLVPAMVAHGINNGLLMLLLIVALGG